MGEQAHNKTPGRGNALNIDDHIELGKLAQKMDFISLDQLIQALLKLNAVDHPPGTEFWRRRELLTQEELSVVLAYIDTRTSHQDQHSSDGVSDTHLTRPFSPTTEDELARSSSSPSLSDVLLTLGHGNANNPLTGLLHRDDDEVLNLERPPDSTIDVTDEIEDLAVELLAERKRSKSQPPWWPQIQKQTENRYKLGKILGQGGSAKVIRAFDREMGRTVAMKILTVPPNMDPQSMREHLARFIAEAQIIGQLEHPNIVPIYDMGSTANAELFYTMREIRRHSLREVLQGLAGADTLIYDEYTLPKLLNIFRQVCQAVHYAHVSGVVHRDLKPDNIMLGDFGEVLVADWGLAKVQGRSVVTDFSLHGGERHIPGQTLGTPAYMSPEQARGELEEVDELSDIYALGAILYEILTLTPPFMGTTPLKVMTQIVEDKLEKPSLRTPTRDVPNDLDSLCLRLLAKNKKNRLQSAFLLLNEIEAFLEGIQPREANRRCQTGKQHAAAYFNALEAIQELERRAQDANEAVQSWEPPERKRLVWQLQDEVQAVTHQMAQAFGEASRAFTQALVYEPDNRMAQQGLAQLHWSRFKIAEQEDNLIDQLYFGSLIRQFDLDNTYTPMLDGHGTLTLASIPSGITVFLEDLTEKDRRMTPSSRRILGETPTRQDGFEMGVYQLTLKHEGYRSLKLPMRINRCAHVDLVIEMLPESAIGDDLIYVPAGNFVAGGDEQAFDALERSTPFVESFLIGRYPVTFKQYLEYIQWLWPQNPEIAKQRLPQTRGDDGMLCRFDHALRSYVPDEILIEGAARQRYPIGRGFEWSLPVVGISLDDTLGYLKWRSAMDNTTYRLPTELEWEKATRGTDGRIFPWGNRFDPTFCKMRFSRPEPAQPEPIGTFIHDVSPYGVRDCAGGVREWVAEQPIADTPIHPDAQTCTVRGGAWNGDEKNCRLTSRIKLLRIARSTNLGFRLARDI